MKKFSPTLFLLFLSLCIYGQSPEKMSYQAVIRDASNTLVTNQSIGMQISILQTTITGTTVYAETHTVTTNLNGLVSLEIGTGSTSDTFSTIDWSAGPYFIKTETDPTGGSSYTITGTSQLMSVPFAMYAKSSGNGITTDQSDAIAANTDKVGYTEALVSANTDVVANTLKVGYTDALVSANTDVTANTAKVGYTDALVSANTDVVANTAKTGITTGQSDAIVANTANRLTNTNLITALDARIAALEVLLPAEIGDFRAGGVVFWVDPSDNTHGLVCAIQDQSSGIRWYNGSYSTTGATGTAVGTGSTNTTTIITEQGATATSYAAGLARAYTAGGYTDWFLPSKDELNQMYLKKTDINTTALANGGVIFTNFYYWSSTEFDYVIAWFQDFDDGNPFVANKDFATSVRAVRAF